MLKDDPVRVVWRCIALSEPSLVDATNDDVNVMVCYRFKSGPVDTNSGTCHPCKTDPVGFAVKERVTM